jgi:hypothetical protein
MLDLEEHAAAARTGDKKSASPIRGVIVRTAIEAAIALARQNPDADLSDFESELEKIAAANDDTLNKAQLPPQARFDAQHGLDALRKLGTSDADRKE